ncbi:MAG: hypothetical protein RTU63_02615, partial [Candidatus Thorarchaeota archaeon]
ECPDHIREQLGRFMTGEEVNGFLSPGKFYTDGNLYTFDFTIPKVSEQDESIVFHEERYIRIFLRSQNLNLRKLPPGTYLRVEEQQWLVSVGWEDQYFEWTAQSLVSGLPFRGNNQKVELTHGRGKEKECEHLMEVISSQIPREKIQHYSKVREQVLSELEDRGYAETSPECQFKIISQSESEFVYGLFLSAGLQNKPLCQYSIGVDEPVIAEAIIDGISEDLTEGELSSYNIVSVEWFLVELASWLEKHVLSPEDGDESPEAWTLTLSVNVVNEGIEWNARQGTSGQCKSGAMWPSHDEIRQLGLEAACEEVIELFELEVIPHLQEIDNLDEVVKEQIPDVVREIIQNQV